MRADEAINGTSVFDEQGNVYGLSKVAGSTAVLQTAMTRCVLVPVSCLVLPPILMSQVARRLPNLGANGHLALNLLSIFSSLALALPASLAIFPQVIEFNPNQLEEKFQNLKTPIGGTVSKLYANKGL
eukprot:gene19129-19493_t